MTLEPLPLTPDFEAWEARPAVARAHAGEGLLRVEWEDGLTARFHHVWLRDACPCESCMDPVTREITTDVSTIPDTLGASAYADAVGALVVRWSDGHVGRYHPGWLRAHRYDRAAPATPPAERANWDAGVVPGIPTFAAADVLGDDGALLAWLDALVDPGLARLTGLACEEGAVLRVAARIGVLRETNFGRLFDVRAKAERDSNAYTAAKLIPHTDLPTREVQPGVQMLHCLRNSVRGGESVMIDGLRVVEILRREHPAHYAVLTTVPIPFTNRARGTDYRWRSPVIVLDGNGHVTELRPGFLLRAPLDVAFDRVEHVYAALQCFYRLLSDPSLRAEFPFAPGDVVAFDNRRVLHARNAFDPASGERWLQGCYLDRDELLSRRRILRNRRK